MPEPAPRPRSAPDGATWKRSERWKPGRPNTASGGFGVECPETGETGYCKPKEVARERICSDLARRVGVPVPEMKLGRIEGQADTVGISMAHGSESMDVRHVREKPELFNSIEFQAALRSASGLLPFHAWVGTRDLKDDHLVVAGDKGSLRVAGIDFADALGWDAAGSNVTAPGGPPALIANPDPVVIKTVVERIEGCSEDEIADIVRSLPDELLGAAEKDKIVQGLLARRGKVRGPMQERGWMS